MMKVVYCCDEKTFAWQQLIYSIKSLKQKCNQNNVKIFILTYIDLIPSEMCSYENSKIFDDCTFIDANKYKHLFPKAFAGYVKSTMCFAKLFIPLMDEFKTDDKVLYLDNDIEITNGRILDVFNEDATDVDVLAVKESKRTSANAKKFFAYKRLNRMSKYASEKTKQRLKELLYVNTGCLLFNLANIRTNRQNYESEILECIACQQDHPKMCSMQDEDIANVYFDIKVVSPKYAMRPNHWNPTMHEIYAVHYNQHKTPNDYPPKKRKAELPDWTWTTGIAPADWVDVKEEQPTYESPTNGRPVDIVYVVGKPQKCKDNYMLRCSLRSVEKHCKNVGRIIVAGYPPDWLSDNVIKIQVDDIDKDKNNGIAGKHWNILNCIKTVINTCKLDKPFLYSSDDHFFLKDVDLTTFPRYFGTERCPSRAYLEKTYKTKEKWGPYLEVIACTRELLDKNNLPNRMACCHTDTWMDPKYIDDVVKLAYSMPELTPTYGFEPTCMFNAFFERDNPNAQYKRIEDCDRKVIFLRDFDKKTSKDTVTFTIHERLDKSAEMEKILLSKYPNMSKYERDCGAEKFDSFPALPAGNVIVDLPVKKRLAICWIGIGNYNFMFKNFYETFKKYFCIECQRTFFVFTDQPSIAEGKDDCIVYPLINPCTDRGWVRFRKFKYLMMAENAFLDYDYVCYMNGNMLCQQPVVLSELLPHNKKYAAVLHPKTNMLKKGHRLLNAATAASFVPNFDFRYKQSGWILCETIEFLRMANTIEGWRHLDKATGADVHVQMHDEAYYNKYMFYHEKITQHLDAAIYLCPITWPISGKAKMVQIPKDKVFKENNFILGQDTKTDALYVIPHENLKELEIKI